MELNEYLGAVLVNGHCKLFEALDVIVLGSCDLSEHSCSGLFIDSADLRHDKSASAGCSVFIVLDHSRARRSVEISQIGAHRGHYQSVLDFDIADLTFFK